MAELLVTHRIKVAKDFDEFREYFGREYGPGDSIPAYREEECTVRLRLVDPIKIIPAHRGFVIEDATGRERRFRLEGDKVIFMEDREETGVLAIRDAAWTIRTMVRAIEEKLDAAMARRYGERPPQHRNTPKPWSCAWCGRRGCRHWTAVGIRISGRFHENLGVWPYCSRECKKSLRLIYDHLQDYRRYEWEALWKARDALARAKLWLKATRSQRGRTPSNSRRRA